MMKIDNRLGKNGLVVLPALSSLHAERREVSLQLRLGPFEIKHAPTIQLPEDWEQIQRVN